MMLIEMDALKEIIKLAIASSYVKHANSVSVLIIAKPESGKTEALKEYSNNHGVQMVADITYSGLIDIITRARDGNLKTLLIPDLLKVYGRNINVSKNFFTLLNEVIEEGVRSISTYEHNIDLGKFVRINMVGAVTKNELFSKIDEWGQIGFLSRVIPFSYSYSPEQVSKIFNFIMNEKNSFVDWQMLSLSKDKKISISKNLAEKILVNIVSPLRMKFTKKTGEDIYGFRFQKNLQTLAKASALLDKRDKVSVKDVNKLVWLSNWMNFDLNVIE